MKGVVFVELVEFMEDQVGYEVADRVLSTPGLVTGGAYTAVGTYPGTEAVSLVSALSSETGIEVPVLLKGFGKHLFSRLAAAHPQFLAGISSPIALLGEIEHHIHVEVRKLYPDAELPTFEYELLTEDELIMVYRSSRGLADLCEGLIVGCFEHFGVGVSIEREALAGAPGTAERFHLRMA